MNRGSIPGIRELSSPRLSFLRVLPQHPCLPAAPPPRRCENFFTPSKGGPLRVPPRGASPRVLSEPCPGDEQHQSGPIIPIANLARRPPEG